MASSLTHGLNNGEELTEDDDASVPEDGTLSSMVLRDPALGLGNQENPSVSSASQQLNTYPQEDKLDHSARNGFMTSDEYGQFDQDSHERSNNLIQYSADQDDSGDLAYNNQALSEALHSIRLPQYNDSTGQNGGLVSYSDVRDGIPITSLPLLADNGLVNLVELSDGLSLDAAMEASGLMLRSDFVNERGQTAVMAGENNGANMTSISSRDRRVDSSMNYVSADESMISNSNLSLVANGAGSTQYQLTLNNATDGQGNVIAFPVNFLSTSNGQAFMQQFGIVRLEGDQNGLFLPQYSNNVAANAAINSEESIGLSIPVSDGVNISAQLEKDPLSTSASLLRNKSGRPTNSSASKNRARVLGSGPLAISAQGIVQQVDGRRVTVLPRPEDLQRLKEHKALVIDVPDKKSLNMQKRRGPVPVRPHQRYGRARGRRGRPPRIVGEEENSSYIPGIEEKVISKRGRRGRRGKRGRGRGSVMVVSSTGRRPGRPKKATTLLEGPNGARMIHTGPDINETNQSSSIAEVSQPNVKVDSINDILNSNPSQSDPLPDEILEDGNIKRRLPPRVRGTKYNKLIEALIRPDDEIPSESSDDDPDFTGRGSIVKPPTYRTGKRGRPRKQPIVAPPLIKLLVNSRSPVQPSHSRVVPTHKISVTTGPLPPSSSFSKPKYNSRLQDTLSSALQSLNDSVDEDIFASEARQITLSADCDGQLRVSSNDQSCLLPNPPSITLSSLEALEDEELKHITISKADGHSVVSLVDPCLSKEGFPDEEHETSYEGDFGEDFIASEKDIRELKETHVAIKNEVNAEHITLITGGPEDEDFDFDIPDCEKEMVFNDPSIKKEDNGIYVASCSSPIPEPFVSESSVIEIKEENMENQCFMCQECDEVLYFKRDYIRHLRVKHNQRPLECNECGKSFTSRFALQDHETVHSLENPFRCNICGDNFDRYSSLKAHQRSHSEEMEFICEKCGKHLPNASQLKKHLQMHEEGVAFSCGVCGKLFGTKDALSTHIKSHNKDRPHVCDICNLGFLSSGGLNRHRKVHKRMEIFDHDSNSSPDLWCKHCHANFTYEESLKKHLRVVHNIGPHEPQQVSETISLPLTEERVVEELQEQLNEGYAPKNSELYDVPGVSETLESKTPADPFRCGICEESFTDVDMLCDHFTNCHTGEQKYYCDLCCVGCSDEQQMLRHKLVHTSEEQQSLIKKKSDDLPHLCLICGKSYKTAQELSKHGRVHNVDKPYKCPNCSASFPIKSALDKHLLVHTGERPFKCDICLKSFRQSAALVRHKLWTHRLKNQNKCEICGKTFFTAALLLFHLDVHGEQGTKLKNKLKELAAEVGEEEDDLDQEEDEENDVVNDREKNVNNKCEYCSKTFPTFVALLTHKLSHKLSASYKCDHCHRTFREKRYLQKHKATHKGVRSWKCDICKKGFAAKLTLIRHSQVHLREALRPTMDPSMGDDPSTTCTLPLNLKCNECNVTFMHKSHYVRHKLLHSGTPLLKCGLCDKMFVHKSDIIRHKVMHSFMFSCDICGRNFHKRSLYLMHKKKHLDEKPFKCPDCFKCFSSSSNYNAHRRIHNGEKPFKCDKCNYRCSQSGRLTKHKRMHQGIKPFECHTCGKFFANAESLKVHQRLHTGDRPFKCETCHKTFVNSGSLSQHMKDHIKEEMFKCNFCPHKFKKESHLKKHKMFHEQQINQITPQTLFMCEICGRVFDKKKYLYTHGNVHSRQKTFNCQICHKQLASRLALKNHEHIHTGKMPYKCTFCRKEFRSNSNLKRHLRIHEGQETWQCDECKETFLSKEDFEQHSHMHVMMVDAPEQSLPQPNHTQLYVFESMGDDMESTPQLLVNSPQQQLFVEGGSQPLLVFPDNPDSQFNDLQAVNHADSVMTNELAQASQQLMNDHSQMDHHSLDPPTAQTHIIKSEDMDMVHDSIVQQHEDTEMINLVQNQVQDLQSHQVDENIHLSDLSHHSLSNEQTCAPVSGAKAHQCSVCHKVFAKRQYLTKHMYRHREVKPHVCDVCGKGFAQKFEVVVHKIKHTGEKPYSCDICGKQFRSKVNLNNHKMRHNGEFPFLCSVCRKGFSTQLQLERHVTLHAGGMLPFTCQICNKGYSIRLNLIKHMAKAHNQNIHGADEFDETVNMSSLSQDSLRHQSIEMIQDLDHIQEDSGQHFTAYKNSVGQLTIKNEEELMGDFNGPPTVTILSKGHNDTTRLDLSNDVNLALGPETSIAQSFDTKGIEYPQQTQQMQSDPQLFQIRSDEATRAIKIDKVVYPSYASSSFSTSHLVTSIASLDSQKRIIKEEQDTPSEGAIAISLLQAKQDEQYQNQPPDTSDFIHQSDHYVVDNNKDNNIIDVSPSILKNYYIHEGEMTAPNRDIVSAFLQDNKNQRVQSISAHEFTDGNRVVNLRGEPMQILDHEQEKINVEQVSTAGSEPDEEDPIINVVVVSEDDSIDVDGLS